MKLQTIAQQRAKHALSQIESYIEKLHAKVETPQNKNLSDKEKMALTFKLQGELLSYINSMGPMILMSGFGQTCAFYLSKKKDEHQSALAMVADWLESGDRIYANLPQKTLIDKIVVNDAITYQLAQIEALAYLDWLKKFAKAFLKVKKEGDQDATTAN